MGNRNTKTVSKLKCSICEFTLDEKFYCKKCDKRLCGICKTNMHNTKIGAIKDTFLEDLPEISDGKCFCCEICKTNLCSNCGINKCDESDIYWWCKQCRETYCRDCKTILEEDDKNYCKSCKWAISFEEF